jgi:2-polyprenyl-3-methyl-5-hydroxy-6-metoxy-1,4-benzoquinol methylase
MRSFLLRSVNRFPAAKALLKRLRNRLTPATSVSSDYREIDASDRNSESERLVNSWKEEQLPERQRALVDKQLREYRSGTSFQVFDVFIAALDTADGLANDATILEIGCSSGYYSEVLDIAGKKLAYTGCDYSESFISLARSLYPGIQFDVEDATRLKYADSQFDMVVSGCCLLHIPEYEAAIAETTRVARDYVVFHRTPVVYGQETRYYRKKAYGTETIEIHFSEYEFLNLISQNGLVLVETFTLHDTPDPRNAAVGSALRTYLCRKSI